MGLMTEVNFSMEFRIIFMHFKDQIREVVDDPSAGNLLLIELNEPQNPIFMQITEFLET